MSLLLVASVGMATTPTDTQTQAQPQAKESSNTLDLLKKVTDRFTFTGYAQAGWEYHENQDPNNEFKISRIIVMSDLRLTDRWHAFLMFDFKGASLHEYWTSYELKPWLRVKLGQFKTPFTIECPLSPSRLESIYVTSLATSYMIGGGSELMMPAGSGRDLGLTVYGDIDKWVSYDLAVMNGRGRNRGDDNNWKDFVARLTFHPHSALNISASTILGKGAYKSLSPETAAVVNGLETEAPASGDYTRNRFAVGAELKTTPAGLRAEWMWGKDGKADSNGGYVMGRVSNIGVKGLELIAGFDHLKAIDLTTNRYQAGVQYWFLNKCRIQLGYSYTKHPHADGENAVLTQLQVGF